MASDDSISCPFGGGRCSLYWESDTSLTITHSHPFDPSRSHPPMMSINKLHTQYNPDLHRYFNRISIRRHAPRRRLLRIRQLYDLVMDVYQSRVLVLHLFPKNT
ncbi:hypothetical protein R3P38DRAFT_3164951 [Favolaschia claudopus]|uniref:Uncharacterized protein n=1 Tax=Favolaschia claudopus TaxID=2862362 RepID=A0AAW0EHB4_9AGAR